MSESNDLVLYTTPIPKVARIILNRPATRNAQNTDLLYALNAAFDRAAHDDEIVVIVLAANGPHFSSGHDLSERRTEGEAIAGHDIVLPMGGFDGVGAEGRLAYEEEVFLGLSERWRNIPKPTIAEVQGKVIAGGLMLVWPCDLIVASDDAEFSDNVVAMGANAVEFFNHPYEFGVRKAKELLFTGGSLGAVEAHAIGMVNRVVPRERLTEETLELAARIALMSPFALKLAKKSVNNAQDAGGRPSAIQAAFGLHQLSHSHNNLLYGVAVDPDFLARFPAKEAR
jgi:enoyl-CoA hydratase